MNRVFDSKLFCVKRASCRLLGLYLEVLTDIASGVTFAFVSQTFKSGVAVHNTVPFDVRRYTITTEMKVKPLLLSKT